MVSLNRIERRIRTAGILLIAGLLSEAVCLLWARPLAFILLIGIGFTLISAGILLYLYSLLSDGKVMPQSQDPAVPQPGQITG